MAIRRGYEFLLGVRRGVICIELIGAYHFWNEAAWKMFSREVGWIEFEVFGFGFDRGFLVASLLLMNVCCVEQWIMQGGKQ